MSALPPLTEDKLLKAALRLARRKPEGFTAAELVGEARTNSSAIKRVLPRLVEQGMVRVTGRARATRYHASEGGPLVAREPEPAAYAGPKWSAASLALMKRLDVPRAARAPVAYRRELVDGYIPNATTLLPPTLAVELEQLTRLPEQWPAGTYARKVLEQLLIDLSWASSHLEGNRYTILDTEELFKRGGGGKDPDAIMLLNHKAAIEFMVAEVPVRGLTAAVLRNVHALLMLDLLPDERALGSIRNKVVYLSGSPYIPSQSPQVLEEMFLRVVETASFIRNPVEAAFFLWTQLAYLQPFEDGNKRVSRMAANVPLMLFNQAPLSFLGVERQDYALAMMGVYEFRDFSMAIDLFEWAYRGSHAKYKVVLETVGLPDPFRAAHRETLGEAVRKIVRQRWDTSRAVSALGLPAPDLERFTGLLAGTLESLEVYNCSRYRLGFEETQAWIDAGRPH